MKTALAIAALIFYILVNIYVILEIYHTLLQINLPCATMRHNAPHLNPSRRARSGVSCVSGVSGVSGEIVDYCKKHEDCDFCIFYNKEEKTCKVLEDDYEV